MAANSQFAMAIHILTMLAMADDANLKSDYIAASVNTNAVVIRRLLGQLSAAKFALHGKAPSQDCPIGKNIEAVLCNLQKEIDRSVGEKLGQYHLQDLIEQIDEVQV